MATKARDLTCYMEAIKADDHNKWVIAMEQEMESLNRNETWTLVDLPKDPKVISCRLVFRKKDNKEYKIRPIAKD